MTDAPDWAEGNVYTVALSALRAAVKCERQRSAARIAELEEALRPFARFSQTYPGARDDLEILNLHDRRCEVFARDCHRAAALLHPSKGQDVMA